MVCASRLFISALALWSYILAQHVVFASSNSSIYIVRQTKKNKSTNLSPKLRVNNVPGVLSSPAVKRSKKTTRKMKMKFQSFADDPYFYEPQYEAAESYYQPRHRHKKEKHRAQYSLVQSGQMAEPEHHASEIIQFHQYEPHYHRVGVHGGGEYMPPKRQQGFSHRFDFFGVENPWALFGIVACMLLTLPLLKAVITFPMANVVNNLGRLVYLAYLNRNGTRVFGFRDASNGDFGFDSSVFFENITRDI